MVRRPMALLLCCLLATTPAWADTFTASVDRKQLYADEQVLLTLSLVNSDTRLRAAGLDPNVDLSVLTRDFDVGVPRASHRYNISRNRGRSTSEIKVLLFPKHSGTLHIPPFTVDGQHSQVITLQVQPAKVEKNPPLFVRSGTTQQHLWVGERTIAYLDLYHRIALKSARLGGALDTEPLRLHLAPLPQQERSTTIDGLTYKVSRSVWSLTPVKARPVTIKFPDVWVETATGKHIRLPFTESSLQVRPLPAGTPADILVGKPALEQSLPPGNHPAHHPIPWRITLRAPAALQALPARLPLADTPALKIYFDEPARDWEENEQGVMMAVARYSGYVIPLKEGKLTLPTLELPYFAPQEGRVKQAVLPGAELEVMVAAPAPLPAAVSPTPITAPSSARSVAGSDSGWWQPATVLFAILWLLTGLLWWQRSRTGAAAGGKPPVVQGRPMEASSRPPMIRALTAALRAQSLEEGVQRWERKRGPDPELRQLVQAVQALHYAAPGNEESAQLRLEKEVRQFVKRSRRASRNRAADDPWLPENFARKAGGVRGEG
ncbi:MAG: BatD family protein [Gammaproteobacteria bacterium]